MDKVFALCSAESISISYTLYGSPQALPGIIPEPWAKNKPWALNNVGCGSIIIPPPKPKQTKNLQASECMK